MMTLQISHRWRMRHTYTREGEKGRKVRRENEREGKYINGRKEREKRPKRR